MCHQSTTKNSCVIAVLCEMYNLKVHIEQASSLLDTRSVAKATTIGGFQSMTVAMCEANHISLALTISSATRERCRSVLRKMALNRFEL